MLGLLGILCLGNLLLFFLWGDIVNGLFFQELLRKGISPNTSPSVWHSRFISFCFLLIGWFIARMIKHSLLGNNKESDGTQLS